MSTRKSTYIKRLKQWEHGIRTLRESKKKIWDMDVVRERRGCGTAACAMGWLPEIFPRHFRASTVDFVLFRGRGQHSFEDFFGFVADEFDRITMPNEYVSWINGSEIPRRVVADRIAEIRREVESR